MVDSDRQVPAPSAAAWSIDLVEIGSISNTIEAERTVATAPISSVAVW